MDVPIYKNKQLEDLEGEIWVDAFGYDGIYEVSNLGRIKSLAREVNTRWGTSRLTETKILGQSIMKRRGIEEGLIISLNDGSKNMQRLIFTGFYPEVDFNKNECVMHINKNLLDNRLVNLEKVTRRKSKATDMIKSSRTIIATPKNLEQANKTNKEFYNARTHRECISCGKIALSYLFPNKINKCPDCVNKYVINRRAQYKYIEGFKVCPGCLQQKKSTEFPKLDNTCKGCRNIYHTEYQIKQRETLGDWYVKEYGKYNYKYKEFSPELIDKLREEIKKSREPKHKLYNQTFKTTQEFALYILQIYKIPITTTEYRVRKGHSEYECTLNRKQFIEHNIMKANTI